MRSKLGKSPCRSAVALAVPAVARPPLALALQAGRRPPDMPLLDTCRCAKWAEHQTPTVRLAPHLLFLLLPPASHQRSRGTLGVSSSTVLAASSHRLDIHNQARQALASPLLPAQVLLESTPRALL